MELIILGTEWAFPNSPLCNGRKATHGKNVKWAPHAQNQGKALDHIKLVPGKLKYDSC